MSESKVEAPTPRQAIKRMLPYAPPTASRQGKQRFDFNENTRGCSPKVIAKLREIATADFLSIYPEYEGARARMGEFFGVGPEQVMFSDGTDEGIHVLVQTFVEPDDEVVMPWPTFPMFRFYVQVAAAEPVKVPYRRPGLEFPFEEVLDAITPATRAVVVANPNNPTGGAIGLEAIETILKRASGAAVLIDEAYFEFYGVTALDLLPRYPNLFLSRTFSKAYGLAGLRVGCVISSPENIQAMRKGQSPYSVNAVGIQCALAAIEDQEYVNAYVGEVIEARGTLCAALDRLGVERYPTDANFVLAQFGDDEERVCREMRERGMLLRSRAKEIPGAVRITVGDKAQTAELIAALEQTLQARVAGTR